MATKALQPRVHVLGLGGIGTFAAHCLAEVPHSARPSITLLLHRQSLVDQFIANGSQIILKTTEGKSVGHDRYNLEFLNKGRWHRSQPTQHTSACSNESGPIMSEAIDNLIVSVKAGQTVSALEPLKHRLTTKSHILFLQNGSGMIEEVNQQVFTDEKSRPSYIIGVISHGVNVNSPFNITHTGSASTSLGLVPHNLEKSKMESSSNIPYLLDTLPLIPRLNATSYTFLEVFQIQLEKLAVNAFCNPNCALKGEKNKFLFTIPEKRHALLSEISRVIHALPEWRQLPEVPNRFSVERLEETVNAIIEKTAENTCSMLVDLRQGRKTEIHYINGYWCRRGREVGVPTPLNDGLVREILKRQGDEIMAENYP